MATQRVKDKGAVRICEMNTEVLKRVNKRIRYFLDRLPLESQSDIVALNRLLEEQERLMRVHVRGFIPCRIAVFNDNERYRACHLRRRFRCAQRWGKIKKPENKFLLGQ